MLSLVVALTLSADLVRAPVGVSLVSRRAGVEKLAPKVASRVSELLISEGVDPLFDTVTTAQRLKKAGGGDVAACEARQQCALKLAGLLGPNAVLITIDVSKLKNTLDLRLEALSVDAQAPLATADLSVDAANWKELSSAGLLSFVKELKTKLVVKEAPPKPPDTPVKAQLEPPPPPPDPVPLEPVASRKPIGIVLVSVAGVAAVTAGVLLGLALADRATFDASLVSQADGRRLSSLPPMVGTELLGRMNGQFIGALIAGVVALAAGGIAVPFLLGP